MSCGVVEDGDSAGRAETQGGVQLLAVLWPLFWEAGATRKGE